MVSQEKAALAAKLAEDLGYDAAAEKMGVSRETLRRYVRMHKKEVGDSAPELDEKIMRRVRERFTDAELKAIIKGSSVKPHNSVVLNDFMGDVIKIGFRTDTHLGSIYTDPDDVMRFYDACYSEDVDIITDAGDVHEGVSNRPGHVYECTHYGYSAQLDHSREVHKQNTDIPEYKISGNHDRWFLKSAGANIVKELCDGQDNLHFLGHDEGDIILRDGITLKLWHGEDGSSYAHSYRIQKLIESLSGGEKPNILFTGHVHKAFSMFERNIHCVSGGSIQKQSGWMRSKRLPAHTGFWIVKLAINESGVAWFEPRFYPFYT